MKAMKRMISIALVIGLVLASAGVSQARAQGGPGGGHFQGRPAAQGHQFVARPGFPAHPGFAARPGFPVQRGFAARPGFAPHRHFNRGGVFVGVAPFVIGGAIAYGAAPYYYDPGYAYSAPEPSYWYYCQSAGAYYPDVPSCAEPWVPVPAQ
jgi:hypothetical protein